MRRGQTTESERARPLGSKALARRLDQIERLVTPPGPAAWARAGMPLDMSPLVHNLLADARRHAKGRRWLAARHACEAAERLARESLPTIREARLRELAEAQVEQRQKLSKAGRKGGRAERRPQAVRRFVRLAACRVATTRAEAKPADVWEWLARDRANDGRHVLDPDAKVAGVARWSIGEYSRVLICHLTNGRLSTLTYKSFQNEVRQALRPSSIPTSTG